MLKHEEDEQYINDRLPFYAVQNYAHKRAAVDASYQSAISLAALAFIFGTAAYNTPMPVSFFAAVPTFVCALTSVAVIASTEGHQRQMLNESKRLLTSEHMKAARDLLKDSRFREIILSSSFNRKFHREDNQAHLFLSRP